MGTESLTARERLFRPSEPHFPLLLTGGAGLGSGKGNGHKWSEGVSCYSRGVGTTVTKPALTGRGFPGLPVPLSLSTPQETPLPAEQSSPLTPTDTCEVSGYKDNNSMNR
jgi:hypothetical protein